MSLFISFIISCVLKYALYINNAKTILYYEKDNIMIKYTKSRCYFTFSFFSMEFF